jgi:hypothetical protein
MQALSDPTASEVLAWMDHGNGFVILHKHRFALEVMPRHFADRVNGAAKFTSFTRKLKRWGFKRVAKGNEMGAYYHDDFRRGGVSACAAMRPPHGPGATKVGAVADDDEKGDAKWKEEDQEEANTTKEDGPVEDAAGAHSTKVGDEMPPPPPSSSTRIPNGPPLSLRQISMTPLATFDLSHWSICQWEQQKQQEHQQYQQQQHQPLLQPFRFVRQDAQPMFHLTRQEGQQQQQQQHQQLPSSAQGSSVQPSPMQILQQLSLLQHQQQLLQHQEHEQHHKQEQQQQQQPLLQSPFRLVMQDAQDMSRLVHQEGHHQQHQQQLSPVRGSSVQPSPMHQKLPQLSLLQHRQQLRHQQQWLQQHQLQQPLMPLLSMMSSSSQLQQHIQQQQQQLHRTSRQAETAYPLVIHNPLGLDTTSLRKHQQVIANALSVLQSCRDRGLIDISATASTAGQEKRRDRAANGITTPHLGRTSAEVGGVINGDASPPPPAQHDVQGHVYAKMRARLQEVEEFEVLGKRQRTVTSLAATGSSAHVGDHANMLPRLRKM